VGDEPTSFFGGQGTGTGGEIKSPKAKEVIFNRRGG